jgi:hypothetical protein
MSHYIQAMQIAAAPKSKMKGPSAGRFDEGCDEEAMTAMPSNGLPICPIVLKSRVAVVCCDNPCRTG